jgi:hypothetical protein
MSYNETLEKIGNSQVAIEFAIPVTRVKERRSLVKSPITWQGLFVRTSPKPRN